MSSIDSFKRVVSVCAMVLVLDALSVASYAGSQSDNPEAGANPGGEGTAALAEKVQADFVTEPTVVHGAQSFLLNSRFIDDTFRIDVGLPASYGSGAKSYPVIYRLDGDVSFAALYSQSKLLPLDMIEPGMPEVIVVGIGYKNAEEMHIRRQRDLTPAGIVDDKTAHYYEHGIPGTIFTGLPGLERYRGGAEDFLKFIADELDPIVRDNYRTDGAPAGLMGASYGGLFSLYAFLKQSPVFNRYWMGSPGLINDESRYLIDDLQKLLRTADFEDVRIFLSLGEKELASPTGEFTSYGELAINYSRLLQVFNANPKPGLHVHSQVIPGATHFTSSPAGETEALFYLYGPSD